MRHSINKFLISSALLGLTQLSQASDIGVKVILEGEVQPGVYGRVEIGNDSHPDLVYAQPRVVVVDQHRSERPVYLHVPPGHAKHWDKHCREYQACDRRVYFIRSTEYSQEYQREHRQDQQHYNSQENGKKKDKGGDKSKGKHQGNDKH